MTLSAQAEHDVFAERSFAVSSRGPFRSLRALVALDNVGNRAVYDQRGLPQPGRTLQLMFSWR